MDQQFEHTSSDETRPLPGNASSSLTRDQSLGRRRTDRPTELSAVLRSAELAEAFRRALAAIAPRTVSRVTVASATDIAMMKTLRGDVIIIDLDLDRNDELTALTKFLTDPTVPPVVVTSPRLDAAALRTLIRLGVLDVLTQPIDNNELATVLQQAMQRGAQRYQRVAAGSSGKVFSFLGSCGGVGTTSLAVQGACSLPYERDAPDLCFLDLDVQFGSAALLLDVEHHESVVSVIQSPERLEGTLLRRAMVRAHQRFDLLGSPGAIYAVDTIDEATIADTIRIARDEYARTIIDLPALWAPWTIAALRLADVICLVVELTVPSLRLGRRQIDTLRQEGLGATPLVVVANRVQSGLFHTEGVPLKAAAETLGRRVDFSIPENRSMKEAANAGLPLSEIESGRSLEKKLRLMMEGIVRTSESTSTISTAEA